MPRSGFSDSQHRSACLVKIAVRLPLITAYTDALEIMRGEDFDAVVIMGEGRNPGYLISQVSASGAAGVAGIPGQRSS
jgi:hypothetical protein